MSNGDKPRQPDTPRCNALESNPLDSFDHRAWATLARQLERELAEQETRHITEKTLMLQAARPSLAAPVAEKVCKALRELADGYFRDPTGAKMELTIMGRTSRESIIAQALAALSPQGAPTFPAWGKEGERDLNKLADALDSLFRTCWPHLVQTGSDNAEQCVLDAAKLLRGFALSHTATTMTKLADEISEIAKEAYLYNKHHGSRLGAIAHTLRFVPSTPAPKLECLSASDNCRRNNPNASTNCCALGPQYAIAPSATGDTVKYAARYEWLRIHGCALAGSEALNQGLVRRCVNLDEEIDAAMDVRHAGRKP